MPHPIILGIIPNLQTKLATNLASRRISFENEIIKVATIQTSPHLLLFYLFLFLLLVKILLLKSNLTAPGLDVENLGKRKKVSSLFPEDAI